MKKFDLKPIAGLMHDSIEQLNNLTIRKALTKKQKVLNHLKSGRTISGLEALNLYGYYRLSDGIFKLREEGHDIRTFRMPTPDGSTYAKYKLYQ